MKAAQPMPPEPMAAQPMQTDPAADPLAALIARGRPARAIRAADAAADATARAQASAQAARALTARTQTARAALAAALAAGLSACAAPAFPPMAGHPYVSQFLVTQQTLTLPAEGATLTAAERAALTALPVRAPDGAAPAVRVSGPPAAGARMAEAAATLTAAGAAVATAADPALAALTVSAPRHQPLPRPCADWSHARLSHPMDAVVGNPVPAEALTIGCASHAALDAMVADPADLVPVQRAEAPALGSDAARVMRSRLADGPPRLPQRSRFDF